MADAASYWIDALELKLRRSQREEFQSFFSELMTAIHGPDYVGVTPHGSHGDGGVDGYHLPDHSVYQCYGALNGHTFGIAYIKQKILSDFRKARETCPDMARWVFVHNLVPGLPRPLLDTILDLKKTNYGVIDVSHFGVDEFRTAISKLPEPKLLRLLGAVQPTARRLHQSSFRILTLNGMNFVALGLLKNKKNEEFSFSLKIRLSYADRPFTLLGITAHYVAQDGCYCLNGHQEVRLNQIAAAMMGNYFDLQVPAASHGGLMLAEIYRRARPPLMIQTPADCDYGDVRVTIKILNDGQEEDYVRYFRFELGGDLRPIEAQRDPPRLSDPDLAQMLADDVITEEEFGRALLTDQVNRYQIVAFGEYKREMRLRNGGSIQVTPNYRAFLTELREKQLLWSGSGGARADS
ncbi:hypothetical protein [Rhizobium ruizarguesonis]|uniref:hypothetical protein n=1 Tax=Rhizobium ruizarguesonis TaxID=2081791 RepID=UPI0010310608|nr:hypothetical protein [Rhizobium ruizarguesonis]TAV22620.1 hypothetical protein ELI35_31240 [Rhizobium ruizarguesonis]